MTPQTFSSNNRISGGGLWQCLNAEAFTEQGADDDLIGLGDVTGFDIWTAENQDGPRVQKTSLLQDSIEKWIEESCDTMIGGERLRGKVLIGNQVVHQDLLRPPDIAEAVWFSRNQLCDKFALPPLAVEQLSHQSSWYLTFPGYHQSFWKSCEGLGTSRFGFAMCSDREKQTFSAVIVFYRAVKVKDRARLQRDLEGLGRHLAGDLSFIPYLVLQLIIRIESFHVAESDREARQADHEILRQNNIYPQFAAIHKRAHQLAAVDIDTSNGLKLAKRWSAFNELDQRVQAEAAGTNAQKLDLQHGVDFSSQLLENIIETSKRSQEQSSRQVSTWLGMLAYEQQTMGLRDQQTSISIAEASKTIAEETKKDSASMKTLALVTMCFLPATSVSSIFAMPLFDWDQKGRKVVSPSIWIYFVFASALTLLTVGTWWLWQRRLRSGNRVRDASKLEHPC